MDRSSMRIVQTNDHETRLAFKAKLAEKLNAPVESVKPVDSIPFSVGSTVWHPDLGNCTIVSLDPSKNDIVLDTGKDVFSLAFNQVKTKLGPEKVKKVEKYDAFIGETIDRTLPDRPDSVVAYKAKLADKLSQPTQSESVQREELFAVDMLLWHPELGAGKVVKIESSKNLIELDFQSVGLTELVLSQVRSKLLPVDQAPEHVPVKPFIREEMKVSTPPASSRNLVVTIPNAFNTWSFATKYHYLSRNQHLTAEEANDVFAVLDGKKPVFNSVEITWEDPVIVEPETVATMAIVEEGIPELLTKRLWHPDFGECSVIKFDTHLNELLLQTSAGPVPLIMTAALPKLVPLADGEHREHAPKRLTIGD